MNLDELWQKAVRNTQVVKTRLSRLSAFSKTSIPYIFLAESEVNIGNTVVRKGKIGVDKPMIFLPDNFYSTHLHRHQHGSKHRECPCSSSRYLIR